MIQAATTLHHLRAFTITLLLIIVGSSCAFSQPGSSTTKPDLQTMPVTKLATVLVTQVVTREVTRIVEIPVTVTPAETPTYTFAPSLASNPDLVPEITILEHSDCMYGPGLAYLYKYSVFAGNPMQPIGRNLDGSWLYIQAVGGWNPCWIQTTLAKFTSGNINGLPIVYSRLPFSNQYNSPDASAHRDGSEVTITWKAEWMSLDDYRGYLIEAWLCQGGLQVFDPISYVPPLASNTGTFSIKVTDEPGCDFPSTAHIYSAQKQGYSNWSNISWPADTPGN
jgi:hypothetical protein